MQCRKRHTQPTGGIARRRPRSLGFNIFSSELNVNGWIPFKKKQVFSIKVNSLKERICSYRANFNRPFLRKTSLSRETNRKSQKLFPIFKIGLIFPYKSYLPWIYVYSFLYLKISMVQQSVRSGHAPAQI